MTPAAYIQIAFGAVTTLVSVATLWRTASRDGANDRLKLAVLTALDELRRELRGEYVPQVVYRADLSRIDRELSRKAEARIR